MAEIMSCKFGSTEQTRKIYRDEAVRQLTSPKRTVQKHLNADALLELVRRDFQEILDLCAGNLKTLLDDALMFALTMF